MKSKSIEIVHVVAIDKNNCIGSNNQLAWHLSDDLKHFKNLTLNSVVIMGRKTFESIGKALPNRINWVVTRDKNWHRDQVNIANSVEGALEQIIDLKQANKVYIIGGGEIYAQTINIAHRLEVTHVDLDVVGDTYYPEIPSKFKKVYSSKNTDGKTGIDFEFASYLNSDLTLN